MKNDRAYAFIDETMREFNKKIFNEIAALVVMLEEIIGLSQDEIMQHIRKNQVARMGMN